MAGVAEVSAPPDQSPRPVSSQSHINPAHVRTLLWMRWKLTIRGYRRGGVAGIIGLIFSLAFVVFFVGGLGFGTGVAYVLLPRAAAAQVLYVVLAGVYIVWIVLPLLQYTLNEGLDITKLQSYPVTRAEQMMALVLATLMDVGTLGLLGMYIPVAIGWSPSVAAGAITVLALALAYVHTVGASQLVLAAMMGLLRSRRYRDVSIVVFAVLGAACSVVGQLAARAMRFANLDAIQSIHVEQYLQYTPPGMAAHAIELSARGEYAQALGWAAALLALVPALFYVWARVLERSITSAEEGGGAAVRQRPRRQRVAEEESARQAAAAVAVPASVGTQRRRAFRVLSPAALAIAAKDARYLWRDPQLKASLVSSLFILVIVFIPPLGGDGLSGGGFLQPIRVLYAPLPALIVGLNLSLNSLGLERQALQMLYLFPVRPLDVFWGKNLTVGVISFGAQVVLSIGLAALTGGWFYVPLALAAGFAAVLVLMGCGNVTSVLMPFRVRELRTGRSSMSSENGCLRSLLSMVTLGVTAVLLMPVAAALAIPLMLQHEIWLVASLPAAVGYGLILHQVATRLIAPHMLKRAPEILAATTRE